ncbi:HIT family protein [Aureimonas frigidaquae]|uniref:HIT family protein n=1 Tax=Aureimonas frigidaquae TaxID=424757 RepID=UPI0007831C28|nr:HIT family protein [Aureimonas frigidaquae]
MQSQAFILARQLDADTLFVRKLGLCRMLLLNDARFVWLLLVPERRDIVELFDLTPQDRAALMEETTFAARLLKDEFSADKVNVASLGNIVSQFHMHVIARHARDAGWPGSPFGLPGRLPYEPHEAAEVIERLCAEEFPA